MADLRHNGPYIWVTWLTRLLTGENSCEWASWFRAQHYSNSWKRTPSTFDLADWKMKHTTALNECRARWESQGYSVFVENQNTFHLAGRVATLGGKPDLVAIKDNIGVIVDVKTGQPSSAHSIQVLLYMWAVPQALHHWKDIQFDGYVDYGDHREFIPGCRVDEAFVNNTAQLIERLADRTPARRVPSLSECRFCDITIADCPERVQSTDSEVATTQDF